MIGIAVSGCGGPRVAMQVKSHWATSIIPGESSLTGVSCPSTKWCMGVGWMLPDNYSDTSTVWAISQHKSWTFHVDKKINRSVTLNAVTCLSPSDCIAVGNTRTTMPFCSYGACTQGDSTAPDAYFGAIVDAWNGLTWSSQSVPAPPNASSGYFRGVFNAVSCSARKFCVAVGYFRDDVLGQNQPFAERWDGRNWYLMRLPAPAGVVEAEFDGVTCIKTSCLAVGSSVRSNSLTMPFADAWNGVRWVRSATPNTSGSFAADACLSERECIAVGSTGIDGLLAKWDGSRWSVQPPLTAHAATIGLSGVSCPKSSCVAVGWEKRASRTNGLAAEWSGQSWRLLPVAKRLGDSPRALSGASCPSPDMCGAVGDLTLGLAVLGQPATAGSFSF